jgi:glycosyltransferase involved in cell wall biosynthesis
VATDVARWVTYSAEVAVALSGLHAEQPFDVIDFPEWGGEGFVYLLNRTERNRVPCVVHLHGPIAMFAATLGWPDLDSELYRIGSVMEGTCVRLADGLISSGSASADWVAKAYHVPRGRIKILHLGVDTERFRPLAVPKCERPTVAFVGKIAPNKGVDVLLEACLLVRREWPTLKLHVIGRGEAGTMRGLVARAESAGAADMLDFAGFVEHADLPALLSRAHVFAAPSRYEGGPGLVYLEAMACGLPVVACDGSGASDVVTHGRTGILVPPNRVPPLAEALATLLRDATLRERLGQQARAFVEAKADSEKCVTELEQVYRSVVASSISTGTAS